MNYQVKPSRIGQATVSVPGDKSVSHRALMLGSIAEGRTEISGFLAGEDCLATLEAMTSMGVDIERPTFTELMHEHYQKTLGDRYVPMKPEGGWIHE